MPDPKGSWTKDYEEVESDAALFPSPHHEADAMLQLSSTLKDFSTSEPQPLEPPTILRPAKHHSSYTLGPLIHEASSSNSPPDPTSPIADLNSSSSSGNLHPRSQRTTVSSIKSFASSPLNPTGLAGPTGPSSFSSSPFNRSGSRASTQINRIASEESRALAHHQSLTQPATRGSMILYRCVDLNLEDALQPPTPSHLNRTSVLSISGDSIVSLSSDSKYPTRTLGSERGLIAYAYDPSLDDLGSATPAEDDFLHDPDEKHLRHTGLLPAVSMRGTINILALFALIVALLCLFVVYPVIRFYHDNARNLLITFNARVNSTGQVSDVVIVNRRNQIFFAGPIPLIDKSTPLHARVLRTTEDIAYGLVFSDEFTQNGRSFSADHDLIWETPSSSKSDPLHINTKDGSLLVRLDTFQPQHQDQHQDRSNKNRCIRSRVPESGWSGRIAGDREKDQSDTSTDRCLSGILTMKVPVCLSRGGMVEVGLGRTGFGLGSGSLGKAGKGEEDEGTLRRLIYWPGSSDSWTSFNQSESPNTPADVLVSDYDSGSLLALSIGIPIETGSLDPDSESWVGVRRNRVQVEVDYVRIYQPIKSLPQAVTEEAIPGCSVTRNDVMLDLLEV